MEYVRFKDVTLSTQYGYTADETSKTEGTYKYLRITDIVPYFVNFNTVPFCTIPPSKVEQYLVNEGDILIARTGATTGYNYVVQKGVKNTVYASYLIRFNVDKTKVLPSYMKYVLKSNYYYGFINNYIGGSAQPGMNARVFGRFNIPNNSLPIQRRIASILSAYDNLIENNNKRIRLLERMAENLYKEWFVRFRFPGYENAEFENGLPKGWKIDRYSNVVNISAGGDRPKVYSEEPTLECNVPIYSNGIEKDGLYGYTDKSKIDKPCITISARGTVGFVCLRRKPFVPIVRLLAVVPKMGISEYYLYFSSKYNDLEGNGTSQQQLTVPMLNKRKIMIPEDRLLSMFHKKMELLFNQIDNFKNQSSILSRQRDLLLPRLMSGKLEVNV